MGVVHHAAYLPYLEEARLEYLRAAGHPYGAVRAGDTDPEDAGTSDRPGGREFPVVEVFVQYRKPLFFDEDVEVSLTLGAATRTTFQVAYLVMVGSEVRATAVTVHGCTDVGGHPIGLPDWMCQLAAD